MIYARMTILGLLAAACLAAQTPDTIPTDVRQPDEVDDFSANPAVLHRTVQHLVPGSREKAPSSSLHTMATNSTSSNNAVPFHSVPLWTGTFNTANVNYGYFMVGGDPKAGGTTTVPTSLIPISLVFDEFVDKNGQRIKIDVTPVLAKVFASPVFQTAGYGTGATQFSDAIQRAEFYNVMKPDWHTMVSAPRVLTPVVIEVPVGAARVVTTRSGVTYALVSDVFFESQLNTITQLEGIQPSELAIALTSNVFLYSGAPTNCCVLGFHEAWYVPTAANTVQTFAWASWADAGIFASADMGDIATLSHEVAEWMNDPFGTNMVPRWLFPNNSGCQSNLETGDPVEVLPRTAYPVAIGGFTYHPQTEALLQWFSRETKSSAFSSAYTYPDTRALTAPSTACPAGR